jgi:hypothetical protein
MLQAPELKCTRYDYKYTLHLLLGAQLRILKVSIALERYIDLSWCDGKTFPGAMVQLPVGDRFVVGQCWCLDAQVRHSSSSR